MSNFSTSLSALNATSTAVDAVGNNLANLNTVGFKDAGVSFDDLVSQAYTGFSLNTGGFGTSRAQVSHTFSQGAIQTSSGPLDGAIQGDGFFVVKAQTGAQLYSRAGNFKVDASGTLLTAENQHVQGWATVNGTVNTSGPLGDIVVPTGTLQQPVATANVSLNANLNSAAVVGTADATFSTPIQVVDSLGNTHVLTVNFTKTAANAWSYAVTVPGADLTSGTAGTPSSLATGNLTFGSTGTLTAPKSTDPPVSIALKGLANGSADMSINWSLFNPDGTPRVEQVAQASAVSANAQDGLTAAQLTKVSLSDGGQIVAEFSNGQTRVFGQVALASIRNPQSLVDVGNNAYGVGPDTALPVIGAANTGGRGQILGGSLESSTVDIAREFTNLIVYQRSYEANAKVITTEDQLSQATIALKP